MFLKNSRPWGNYQTDYRPLVEFAKENKLKVIAANAPRRYVNMVGRLGKDSLNKLSPNAKQWIAPLPFADSSKIYTDKFNKMMQGHGSENILHSQTLWDATMSYSISEHFDKSKNSFGHPSKRKFPYRKPTRNCRTTSQVQPKTKSFSRNNALRERLQKLR